MNFWGHLFLRFWGLSVIVCMFFCAPRVSLVKHHEVKGWLPHVYSLLTNTSRGDRQLFDLLFIFGICRLCSCEPSAALFLCSLTSVDSFVNLWICFQACKLYLFHYQQWTMISAEYVSLVLLPSLSHHIGFISKYISSLPGFCETTAKLQSVCVKEQHDDTKLYHQLQQQPCRTCLTCCCWLVENVALITFRKFFF